MRSREVHACLFVVLGVVLALAGPVAAGMKPTFAGGGLQVVGPWSTRLEDGVAPELTVDLGLHRRVLAGGGLAPSVLNADKAACRPNCPAQGRPYTGRGCDKIFGCHNGS